MLIISVGLCVLYLASQVHAGVDLIASDDEQLLNTKVHVNVTPPYIIIGLATEVTVQCTFRRDELPSMSSIVSLVIARANQTDQPLFHDLVSIDDVDGHAHNLSQDVNVVSGSIDNNGESTLQLKFRYPDSNLTGLFKCVVSGFDQIGKPVTEDAFIEVLPTSVTDLFEFIQTAKSNMIALEKTVNQLLKCIDKFVVYNKSETFPSLASGFYASDLFQDHRYYLTKGIEIFNYTEAQSECERFGGYLLELDSHDEFLFVQNFILKISTNKSVWTGATDDGHEGFWVNQHDARVGLSFDWYRTQPSPGLGSHCQCFSIWYDWKLGVCYCYYDSKQRFDASYVCEIPEPKC
ncbi:hypothetical protein BgiBS90_033021 [Biomphalaria glabrata]|nr:hypothetical protein BgiBS90_033021 [Biomphalaria glabrata]